MPLYDNTNLFLCIVFLLKVTAAMFCSSCTIGEVEDSDGTTNILFDGVYDEEVLFVNGAEDPENNGKEFEVEDKLSGW